MRATLVSLLILLALPVQSTPAQAAATQPVSWHPCARIRAACNQAGFVRNGGQQGSWHHVGLHSADYDGDAATDASHEGFAAN